MMYRRYTLIPTEEGWRIWDVRAEEWIGKFGTPDTEHYAVTREVAEMRVRDFAGAGRPR